MNITNITIVKILFLLYFSGFVCVVPFYSEMVCILRVFSGLFYSAMFPNVLLMY